MDHRHGGGMIERDGRTWGTATEIAPLLGIAPDTLRTWVRRYGLARRGLAYDYQQARLLDREIRAAREATGGRPRRLDAGLPAP